MSANGETMSPDRSVVKDKGNRCAKCGYNLTGCSSLRCPECAYTNCHISACDYTHSRIYCPSCAAELTECEACCCPKCGREFDRGEMIYRSGWVANGGENLHAPLVKLGHPEIPGNAIWGDDVNDGPARIRPLSQGILAKAMQSLLNLLRN